MNEYYYAAGRIRSLEARMLTAAQLERMAAAADFSAAFAVLSETPYAENLPKLKQPFDFDELLALEETALKELLTRLAPGNAVITALFQKHDYLNLKILLRNFYGERREAQRLSQVGTIDLAKLRLYVFEGIKDFNGQQLFSAVAAAKNAFEESKDPQTLDLILDQHYYRGLKTVCQSACSPLISGLADQQIDLINIKLLVRVQRLKKDRRFLAEALLAPGLVDKDILLDLFDKSIQEIAARLSFTVYFPALAAGLNELAETGSSYLLEKLGDDFIVEQFRKAKYLNSGSEPLVGYFLAKENEMKTLRFILVSQSNYVEPGSIKKRLRVSYV